MVFGAVLEGYAMTTLTFDASQFGSIEPLAELEIEQVAGGPLPLIPLAVKAVKVTISLGLVSATVECDRKG
jgi:hypothetical protein